MESAFSIAIKAFSSILELRDPYTASHQKRVAKIAVAIAKKMNLPDERIKQLNVAALLHDIGKMQIPADILAKPGKS
ncbi:MAG: HD domain-containing protein [Candidatus Cloacimonetes bacterium]|nr:HD domain-containing protein [Candidatus Cloacimonadota bacterium]MBT4332661.1 HD domain-containing protein [Candidatus Cloacimonadota bacterium]